MRITLVGKQTITCTTITVLTLVGTEVLALDVELLRTPVQEDPNPGEWCVHLGAVAGEVVSDISSFKLTLHFTPLLCQFSND